MDSKLEQFVDELMGTWFVNDVSIFTTDRTTAREYLFDLVRDLMGSFRTDFPLMEGQVFNNWREGTKSTQIITCGDLSTIAPGDYFILRTPQGNFGVWFDADASGQVAPVVSGLTLIKVDLITGDSVNSIAIKTSAAIASAISSLLVTSSANNGILSVQNWNYGVVLDPASGIGLTGWTYSQTLRGNTNKLYIPDIDPTLMELLSVSYTTYNTTITNQIDAKMQVVPQGAPLSEAVAKNLYEEFIQNEWSSTLDKPALLYDEVEDKEYILPLGNNFIVFMFKERPVSVDRTPSFIFKAVKWYLTSRIADTVHASLTRYALSKGLEAAAKSAGGGSSSNEGGISPDRISSVSIGNLSLSLSGKTSWQNLSDLLANGGGRDYLAELKELSKTNRDKFEREKFIRYGGMIR